MENLQSELDRLSVELDVKYLSAIAQIDVKVAADTNAIPPTSPIENIATPAGDQILPVG
jgi:hypothetical protein